MQIRNPGGMRVFRTEDQQFIYNVPAGRPMMDKRYPIPVLGDLKVFPAKDYYRHPPFTPVCDNQIDDRVRLDPDINDLGT